MRATDIWRERVKEGEVPEKSEEIYCEFCGTTIQAWRSSEKCKVCGKIGCDRCLSKEPTVCKKCWDNDPALKEYEWESGYNSERCYVSTALLSPLAFEELNLFREYRDRFLNSKSWGRRLIKIYYQIGPELAKKVSQKEWAKEISGRHLKRFCLPLVKKGKGSNGVASIYNILALLSFISISTMAFLLNVNIRRR